MATSPKHAVSKLVHSPIAFAGRPPKIRSCTFASPACRRPAQGASPRSGFGVGSGSRQRNSRATHTSPSSSASSTVSPSTSTDGSSSTSISMSPSPPAPQQKKPRCKKETGAKKSKGVQSSGSKEISSKKRLLEDGLDPERPLKLQKAKEGQARVGIRLRKGTGGDEWLVPPNMMTANYSTLTDDAALSPKHDRSPVERVNRRICGKQSGVIGVTYNNGSWKARWAENGLHANKSFWIASFLKKANGTSRSEKEAEAKALKEAIKFRQQKTKEHGVKTTPRAWSARVSGIKGVHWCNRTGGWKACIGVHGKTIFGGWFPPCNDTEAAVEQARLLAVGSRKRLEAKYYSMSTSTLAARSGG